MVPAHQGIALAMHLMLRHSMIGRAVHACGTDPEAARRLGFDTRRTIWFVYCTAGCRQGWRGCCRAR